jgi:DNA-binding XRE family transcriptional regulator
MFGRETRMLLRHYLEQGSSKSELARQLGVSRDTIHRWIRDGDLERVVVAAAVRYGPRPVVATKLDAYKPIIEARLTAYPELSSVRLLDEIRAARVPGGADLVEEPDGRQLGIRGESRFDHRFVGIELRHHEGPRSIPHCLRIDISLQITVANPAMNRVAAHAQLARQLALARSLLEVMPQ